MTNTTPFYLASPENKAEIVSYANSGIIQTKQKDLATVIDGQIWTHFVGC